MFGTILSGMSTSMFEISVVSNNVANAGTTAFRKSSASRGAKIYLTLG